MNKNSQNEKDKKDSNLLNIIVLIIMICCVVAYSYSKDINDFIIKIGNNNKIEKQIESQEESPVEKIEYSDGVILEKIFYLERESKVLIYKNKNKDVFTICKPELWKLVKPYDSVRVGYTQDTTSFNDYLNFVSIEVLGRAKDTVRDFKIISRSNNKKSSEGSIIIQ